MKPHLKFRVRKDGPKIHLRNWECAAKPMPMCGHDGVCLFTDDPKQVTCFRCIEGRRWRRHGIKKEAQ